MMTAMRGTDLSASTRSKLREASTETDSKIRRRSMVIDTMRCKNDIPDFNEQLGTTGESASAATKSIAELNASVAEVTEICVIFECFLHCVVVFQWFFHVLSVFHCCVLFLLFVSGVVVFPHVCVRRVDTHFSGRIITT